MELDKRERKIQDERGKTEHLSAIRATALRLLAEDSKARMD